MPWSRSHGICFPVFTGPTHNIMVGQKLPNTTHESTCPPHAQGPGNTCHACRMLVSSDLPYSLKVMPPSNKPPRTFCKTLLRRYILSPPDHLLHDKIFDLTSNLWWSTRTRLSANRPHMLKHLDKLCCDTIATERDFSSKKFLNSWCLVAFRIEM